MYSELKELILTTYFEVTQISGVLLAHVGVVERLSVPGQFYWTFLFGPK
jgi:hypothetical protein